MASDISRKLFDRKKHRSGVISQQGRVSLDADWNEQLDIQQYRTHTETKDVIGQSGAPKKNGGFRISIVDGVGLTISPGRMYVEGLLCELEDSGRFVTYQTQPYYPEPDQSLFIGSPLDSTLAQIFSALPFSPPDGTRLNIQDGLYIVYLDAWQREISFLDDPSMKEVALGEADTTARLQTVWQVKLLNVAVDSPPPELCEVNPMEWDRLIAAGSGKICARTNKDSRPNDPCSMKPTSGFRGIENQLYRIEIQRGGVKGNSTFKWSRDNATLETRIEVIDGSILTVTSTGKDDVMSFKSGQWVEIIDDVSILNRNPYPLAEIIFVDPATRKITLNVSASSYNSKQNLKLKRWDQPGDSGDENGIPLGSDWLQLEDGIEILFSEGTYQSGDYWLIPARTATQEIEWPVSQIDFTPIEQLPTGVPHSYCRLAMLQAKDGYVIVEDCRELFPSLTELCAEDVSYESDGCELSNARNVQEALDLLCAANDLRDHNRHLHGYGVVCGLKVKCGLDRQRVTIENGYALDCDGNIVRVKSGISYAIVANAIASGLLKEGGTGEFSMSIAYQGTNDPLITIEEYKEKGFWEEILEDSLILDFYDQHIKPLYEFVIHQLPFPLTSEAPVPIGQQRLSALINLLVQLVNSASGPYIFLSGNAARKPDCKENPEEKQNDDQLLLCLFRELKDLLASETYCAMFDNDRPFPEYKIDPGLDTIYGPTLKWHSRLRLHPGGMYAYTCGMDNKIFVYDLKKQKLLQTLSFPSTSNIKIQDVAISLKGNELYAIGLLDDKDSVLAVASIDTVSGKHDWINGSSVKCASKYVTLGINSTGLYAIAKGKGLIRITGIGTPAFAETLVSPFNATGLLWIPVEGKFAFAGSNNGVGEQFSYTEISSIDLSLTNNAPIKLYPTSGVDRENDLLIIGDMLYVTGQQAGLCVVKKINISDGTLVATINLETNQMARLAVYSQGTDRQYLLVSLGEKYKVSRIDLQALTVDTQFRIPTQLFPIAMVLAPGGSTGYVLNAMVNTMTVIDMERTFANPSPNYTEEAPEEIADYHDAVIAAYHDLMSHLLQYLKDAFCGQFLIDCPSCDTEKEKVYLGSVKIRDGKVYRICNFSKRKYVKTFRTWSYWLSTVPVLPLAKRSFEKFCCTVLDKSASLMKP